MERAMYDYSSDREVTKYCYQQTLLLRYITIIISKIIIADSNR